MYDPFSGHSVWITVDITSFSSNLNGILTEFLAGTVGLRIWDSPNSWKECRQMTGPKWGNSEFCLKTLSSLDLTAELTLDSFQTVLTKLKDLKRGEIIGCLTSTNLIAY